MEHAIAVHFNGDSSLYRSFSASCTKQFAADAVAGQAALVAGDLQALRRRAHDLSSVLVLLGHSPLGKLAAMVEMHAAADNLEPARLSWQQLRIGLEKL